MNQYHKIQGLYKRDMDKKSPNYGKFIIGQYSCPEFELLKDIQWVWTEKIDGTNVRVLYYTHPLINEIELKGKTDKAELPLHLFNKLHELFYNTKKWEGIIKIDEDMPDVCLYGEGYGYKIQSGCKYFGGKKEVDFILFDVKIGNIWLKREDVEDIANKLKIKVVPIIDIGTINEAINLVKTGFKSTFGDFVMEGLVLRPKHELLNRRRHRIITKIKYKDFEKK